MNVRERMVQYRQKNRISLAKMSREIGVSTGLLSMVEGGWVTHPKIVEKICDGYSINKEDAEDLLPENYRPSSPKYDPEMYKDFRDRESGHRYGSDYFLISEGQDILSDYVYDRAIAARHSKKALVSKVVL